MGFLYKTSSICHRERIISEFVLYIYIFNFEYFTWNKLISHEWTLHASNYLKIQFIQITQLIISNYYDQHL